MGGDLGKIWGEFVKYFFNFPEIFGLSGKILGFIFMPKRRQRRQIQLRGKLG
jgi:hypothetical protein